MATKQTRTDVERWFLRRGVPHFIQGYSAREDILTRVVPFLAVVFVGEVFVTFGDRHRGWVQAATFLATLGILLGAVVLVNRIRGRAPFALPDDVGALELAVFVLVPPLAALLFANDPGTEALALFVINIVVLGLAYLATSYGIVPMVSWGVRQIRRQLDDLAPVLARALPFLLLFSAFFLLTTEMWQVADELSGVYFAIVIVGMVAVGALFVFVATRTDIDELARFDSWHDVGELCEGTPAAHLAPTGDSAPPDPPPLQRGARLNIRLVMFVSQAVQIALVSASVYVFYLVFCVLTIREPTLTAWLGADQITNSDRIFTASFLGRDILLTRQLLYVAAFVAAFAGLQFTVQVVTDANYRREFASDMAHDVRQALAVRAVTLRRQPRLTEEDVGRQADGVRHQSVMRSRRR